MSDESTATPGSPGRKPFRHRRSLPRMAPEGAERQSRVALLAWDRLGGDAAIKFLNSHDEALGGRPIDLAVASAAGCEAVERAIAARAGDSD